MSSPVISVATNQALRLDIRVSDDMWLGSFDRLEVFRSRALDVGPYTEITGPVWAPARFSVPAQPYVVNGLVLKLEVNERTEVDVTFSGSDPISAASIATQIQAQGLGLVHSYVASSKLFIESVAPGAAASLRILPSDVAGALGLYTTEPLSLAFGQDARPVLTQGKELYSFVDAQGDSSYFYKTRFINQLSLAVSDYSPSFQAQQTVAISPSNLIVGTLDLVDAQGRPATNVRILLFYSNLGGLVEGKAVLGSSLEQLTDANGHVEFLLVRGTPITVSVAGTSLARDITVPTDPTKQFFSLLDPTIAGPDNFNVQVPNISYAVRRTL